MTLPWDWEPPPSQQQPPVLHARITNHPNSNCSNTNRTTPTTPTNNNSDSLGNFDVLLSFLQLERTSLATPGTVAPPPPPQPTTAATSAAPPSSPPAEDDPFSMIAPTWDDSPNDISSETPSTSTSASTTSQLGDLSLVMRYLQAHKAYNSFASANSLSQQDTLNHTSSSSPAFALSPLTQTIPSHDRDPPKDAEDDEDKDEDEDTLTINRRRLKKKATRKLPIDEPSSSSCGGWVSSESDHKEEVMGRSPEEPGPVVHEDTSNSQAPPNTSATIADFLAKELEQQYRQLQQQQQQQKLGQPTDNSIQQLNIHSLSIRTVANPDPITLPQPPSAATNNKITAPAAVISANVSSTGTAFIRKKRVWYTVKAKVLREMKALFMEEQKRKHSQQQLPTLGNNRPASIGIEPSITVTTTTSTPITLVTPPKAAQSEDVQELVLDQTPGSEPEFQWRPRSHYNNFWRSCTNNNSTTADTMTDTNRLSSSSSSSEEESSFRVTPRCNVTPAPLSAFAFGSTTSTRPISFLSEDSSKSAESKRLLALRVRDSFLVPRGIGLLDQALSRAESHLPDPVTLSPPQLEERPKPAPTTRQELGTMKSLISITTSPSALPQPEDKSRSAPATSTSTEQQKIDPTPPPPLSPPPKAVSVTSSNERVFIFVDNSNILHGFYQSRQYLDTQRVTDGISVDGSLSSYVSSRPKDGQDQHHNQDRTPPNKSPAHSTTTLPSEEGMALVTPTTTTVNNDAPKSFPPGTSINNNGTGTSPKAKMARGSHLLPKFNYSQFFGLLKRDRTAARQVLVGSSPLFQELDEAMEHQYETIILRRVKKFVQGELGVVPIPVKQLRFPPSHFNNNGGSTGLFDGAEPSLDKSTPPITVNVVTPPATTTATGLGSSGGGSQGEQGVDELLHLKMLETLLDHEPSTIVLATGDGGDSEFGGGGFYAVIKRALNRGWHVEVVSWEDQLSGVYLDLALEYGYSCEHKSATTGGGKQCHALSSSSASSLETLAVADGHKKMKKQKMAPGVKKQRALALAQEKEREREREREMEKEKEGKQRGCGHLRVWCLDWYGDILLQPTPTPSRSE
ncbi:hypothetical protein EC957_003698 [Mortierella hygrophila]|uniref:NYN domain-containing protein n=1 Tax=Mortierella hygrophila TaxID=979708 RepID=A0A9P6F2G6_9FUNG|nr:hypothetical protein EC957_003698 [Mortierella hygrophila]